MSVPALLVAALGAEQQRTPSIRAVMQKQYRVTKAPFVLIKKELDSAYNELRRGVVLKGFRPGHAPRSLLERFFGDQVRGETIQKLIREYTGKALDEKLKTLKASLPDQSAITVQPEDTVAYADLVETVDTCMGQNLRNVTVAPMN